MEQRLPPELLKLTYSDLLNYCGNTEEISQICDDNSFWTDKIKRDWGIELSPLNPNRLKLLYPEIGHLRKYDKKIFSILVSDGPNAALSALFTKAQNSWVIQLLINLGATNVNEALIAAINTKDLNYDLIKTTIDMGATNIEEALMGAIRLNITAVDVLKILIDAIPTLIKVIKSDIAAHVEIFYFRRRTRFSNTSFR